MKQLHRNRRKIYMCKAYRDGSLVKYEEPVLLKENWQLINTSTEVKQVGLEVYDGIRIKTSPSHAKYYHVGDRAYVFVDIPEQHDENCRDADYVVDADPLVTLNECHVLLKKRSGKNGSKNIY